MKKDPSVLVILLTIVFLLSACSIKEDARAIKFIEQSLEESNQVTRISSEQAFHSLIEKTTDPSTSVKASIWLPHAKKIQEYTEKIIKYIDGLIEAKEFGTTSLRNLVDSIVRYEQIVLDIDSYIRQQFEQPTLSKRFLNQDQVKNFKNLSPDLTKILYASFSNNIRSFEYKLIRYCNDANGMVCGYGRVHETIVNQNATVFKPGQSIEITGGVGNFHRSANAEFIINGREVATNDMDLAIYKTRVPNTPGKYTIPITIIYIDQDGIKNTFEKNIEYTVAKPCDQ